MKLSGKHIFHSLLRILMKIAICDDEKHFQLQLKNTIEKHCQSLDMLLDIFSNGQELLNSLKKTSFDVYFLDIEMPGIDGLTLSKKIRDLDREAYIIFLTSHTEFAMEGYEVNALRFLSKPVNEEKLREVLSYIMDKKREGRKLAIKCEGEDISLNLKDIIYMEAQDQYVNIVTTRGSYLTRRKINDFEVELSGEGFYRCHRSFIVSIARIERLSRDEVSVEGGSTLPLSRGKYGELKELLYSYVSSEAF